MIAEYITAADVLEAEAAWQAVDVARAVAEEAEASALVARDRYEILNVQVGFRRAARAGA